MQSFALHDTKDLGAAGSTALGIVRNDSHHWGRRPTSQKALLACLCAILAAAPTSAVAQTQSGPFEVANLAERLGFDQSVTFGNPQKSSVILETTGPGTAIFDYDGDGDNDVLIANGVTLSEHREGTGSPSMLYRNDGPDGFTNVAGAAGLAKLGWGQGVCTGDVDRDGDEDLLITYFGSDTLYINDGKGGFEDGTKAAGLPTSGVRWGAGCAFFDYDRDGRLDLFISNYVDMTLEQMPKPGSAASCYWQKLPVFCGPRSLPKARNYLYRNQGDGTFEDVSESAGILEPGKRFGLGVLAADFNNDGWTDVYVACDQTPSLLYENQRDGSFAERGLEAGVAYNFHGALQAGMGVAAADIDGNGFLDIVKTNFQGDLPSLYMNEDGVFYEDLAREAGLGANKLLGWGVLFLDWDADGLEDILMAHGHIYPEVAEAGIGERYRQPTVLYRGRPNGRFEDVTDQAGPGLAIPRAARGMASGDLDGDGRPEVVVVDLHARPAVLKNEAASGNFLRLELRGTESNRSAIGARVELTTESGKNMIRDVVGGGSFFSQSERALYFGLGSLKAAETLKVRWPNGRLDEFQDVAAGAYQLKEGGKLRESSR